MTESAPNTRSIDQADFKVVSDLSLAMFKAACAIPTPALQAMIQELDSCRQNMPAAGRRNLRLFKAVARFKADVFPILRDEITEERARVSSDPGRS